jgi:hypothetical protein
MVVMTPLSIPSRQFIGVATVMANELVADSVPNTAVIDSAARLGPGCRPVKELRTN